MVWELRLRGSRPGDKDGPQLRYVKEALGRLVEDLRQQGHTLEVCLTAPDGSLEVYEARPIDRRLETI